MRLCYLSLLPFFIFFVNNAIAQICVPQPTVSALWGGCSSNSTLTAAGLTPGGQGSNSSGVLSVSSGSHVNVTNNTSLQMPGDFTYELWVKPTSYTGTNAYFENGCWGGPTLILRQETASQINLYASGTGVGSIAYAPPLNSWTHLALVRSGSTITLFANGSSVGTFSSYGTAITQTTDLRIGTSPCAGSAYNGFIDEFRYWKGVALSQATIRSWMFRELDNTHPNWAANLSCEFKFNGNYSDSRGICTANGVSSPTFAAANYFTYTWTGSNAPTTSTNEVQTSTGPVTSQILSLVASAPVGSCPSTAVTASSAIGSSIYNLGVSGSSTLTTGGTSTFCISNPLPSVNSTLPSGMTVTSSGVWSSSNTGIATVNGSGLVTGVSAGNCNIIYTAGISGCSMALLTIPVTVNPTIETLCVGVTTTTGITAPTPTYATGGNSIQNTGGNVIHTFTSNGIFSIPTGFNSSTIAVLVVAGGGGGGGSNGQSIAGGGGGAGGLRYNSSFAVSTGSYAVNVGTGGSGANGFAVGSAGGNSVFGSITAIGGGGGGSWQTSPTSGGSGGGAGENSQGLQGAAGTSGQGNSGGSQIGGYDGGAGSAGAGGGGAGSAGSPNSSLAIGGNGGNGLAYSISGSSVFYAGGGGGGGSSSAGSGGSGGGGNGKGITDGNGTNGTNGTGGGGGGALTTGGCCANRGGNGGSGIVIVQYPEPTAAVWASSNPSVATVDASGNVTALSVGTTTISCTVSSGSCTNVQTAQITVGTSSSVGTASAAQSSICTGSTNTLNLTGNSGANIQWQQSADGSTGWTNVSGGSGATTTSYTTPSLSTTTHYRVQASGSCVYSNVVLVTVTSLPIVLPTLTISGTASASVGGTSNLCIANPLPAAGTTLSATGGTVTTASGGFRIHTFTSSGTFTGTSGLNAEVLVVAGGGGGGQAIAGGGGGGGVIYNSSFPIASQNYSVTVGAGGAGAPGVGDIGLGGGSAGANSVFGSLTAIGGGGGGSYNSTTGFSTGGSGGGIGGGIGSSAISGTAGQGNSGGISSGNGNNGAGGGGAGSAGGNAVSGTSGAGGTGLAYSISGTSVFYGGGGGGGTRNGSGSGGNGGNGGGGAGSATSTGLAGTANTGGGGGGGAWTGSSHAGGNGGSGIVIIRYQSYTITADGVWSSSNTGVATVNPTSGVVTGVSAGSCNIIYTASLNGCSAILATIPFTVSAAPAAVCVGGTATTGINTPPNATGGTESSAGGFRIHRFTSNGTFTSPFAMNAEVLVVAGGGGGGSNMGGGGGGGGVVYQNSFSVTPGSTTVTVGAGGSGAPAGISQVRGSNGGNSIFGSITAIGGGGGASSYLSANAPAGNGGSGGGGAGHNNTYAGQGIAGQGFNGNGGLGNPNYYPGGGGGAGGVGSTNPATGGPGILNSILGTAYYWGGGGGGSGYQGIGGNGGIGGGGGGAVGATTGGAGLNNGSPGGGGAIGNFPNTPGGNAGANTGGGGGGGSHYQTNNFGGNGGSGIVIVKYPDLGSGVWASSNPSVATVNASGTVTGVSAGTTTISYTITIGNCTSVQTAQLTVNPTAVAGTVTAGTTPQCIGGTTNYTVSGTVLGGGTGTWSSSNPGVATINASGLVTAVGAGTSNIIYTVSGGCGGTVASSATITVISNTTTVSSASTSPSICINTPITNIIHTTTGATGIGTATGLPSGVTATWSSNTITISGTPTASGTFNYSIPLTSGCAGSANATGTITVNAPVPTSTVNVNDYLWQGSLSNNYAVIGNWLVRNASNYSLATALPTTVTPVVIPANQTCVLNQPTISSGTEASDNLTIAPSASLTVSPGATLNLSGNVSNNGTLSNSGTINVEGSWVNNQTFIPNTGSVVFNGSVASTIGGSATNTFYNLAIAKTGNPTPTATLANDITVSNQLTLTAGNLITGSNTVFVSNTAANAISGGGMSSYVQGRLRRAVQGNNTTYVFPVGQSLYEEAILAFTTGYTSATNITAFFTDGSPGSLPAGLTQSGTPLSGILDKGFWSIDPISPLSSPQYTVTLKEFGHTNGTTNPAQYTVIKRPNTSSVGAWTTSEGTHSNTTQTDVGGVVTAVRSGLSNFSDFAIAFGGAALPIELVSFQANCVDNKRIDVTWTTASEQNTSYFRVDKSRNGTQWDVLNTIGAAGNSNNVIDYALTDFFPTSGINYYRLTQYDNDGVFETFDAKSAECKGQSGTFLSSYPNPSSEDFNLDLQTDELEGEATLMISDAKGALVYSQEIKIIKGNNNYVIQKLNAEPGFYYITVKTGAITVNTKHSLR